MPPGPKLPATVTLPANSNTADGDRVHFFTVGAISGGGRYRVRASAEPNAPNRILLIAAPLNSVDSTLHRLLLIELLVTAIALLTMTVVGLWVIRIGLKPLDAMGKTAAAIAAGDLSQRVEEDDRTEVGRLGSSLNIMLRHIEDAFGRLLDLVRSTSGEDRDRVRTHLIDLFAVVGNHDERVKKGRTALMSALF